MMMFQGKCYGCGASLQMEVPLGPGFVPADKYENKKKHRQLDKVGSVSITRDNLQNSTVNSSVSTAYHARQDWQNLCDQCNYIWNIPVDIDFDKVCTYCTMSPSLLYNVPPTGSVLYNFPLTGSLLYNVLLTGSV
jgi:hypothetical protein